jgi:hypothetical protein
MAASTGSPAVDATIYLALKMYQVAPGGYTGLYVVAAIWADYYRRSILEVYYSDRRKSDCVRGHRDDGT